MLPSDVVEPMWPEKASRPFRSVARAPAREVAIAVSLILGVVTRLGAALGALMAINLWLGLYNAPGEWPWTYMFLVVLQLIFLINPPGRSLGVDALAWRREDMARKEAPILALVA